MRSEPPHPRPSSTHSPARLAIDALSIVVLLGIVMAAKRKAEGGAGGGAAKKAAAAAHQLEWHTVWQMYSAKVQALATAGNVDMASGCVYDTLVTVTTKQQTSAAAARSYLSVDPLEAMQKAKDHNASLDDDDDDKAAWTPQTELGALPRSQWLSTNG